MADSTHLALHRPHDLTVPAAQVTARVEPMTNGDIVHLPARFARAALEFYVRTVTPQFQLIEGPLASGPSGLRLGPDQWAVIVETHAGERLGLIPRVGSVRIGTAIAFVNPIHTIFVTARCSKELLACLEAVKPVEVDDRGLPLPWVPPRPRPTDATAGLSDDGDREDDARVLALGDRLPPAPPDHEPPDAFIGRDTIARWFRTLCDKAGFAPPELTLTRGRDNHLGLVTGRVFFRVGAGPLRVHLTTCPNSDLAEILATIVHELAHPLAHGQTGSRAHDRPMKAAMVDLASRQWGAHWFETASAHLDAPIRIVDYWLATSIRAALRDGDPPHPKRGDDDQMARILGKLKKLRELAHNQLGRPEGIAATAAANDLVTLYELGNYGVGLGEIDETQLVDRWVDLEDTAVWRRLLAHGVARHFDVFSLAINATSRMHFFGTYADVVAAEYLYSVSAARIVRECESHITAWKRARGKTTSAETRVEKTSFCDSATIEFRNKLEHLRSEEGGLDAHDTAEEFAREEHAKRGRGWSSARAKRYRDNAAGRAVGRAMEVLHGVSGTAPTAALGLKR